MQSNKLSMIDIMNKLKQSKSNYDLKNIELVKTHHSNKWHINNHLAMCKEFLYSDFDARIKKREEIVFDKNKTKNSKTKSLYMYDEGAERTYIIDDKVCKNCRCNLHRGLNY